MDEIDVKAAQKARGVNSAGMEYQAELAECSMLIVRRLAAEFNELPKVYDQVLGKANPLAKLLQDAIKVASGALKSAGLTDDAKSSTAPAERDDVGDFISSLPSVDDD